VFSFVGDGTALGHALAEKEKLREQSVWLKSLPLSHKYLILAVFLAAANPKESDAFTFGSSSRGRRKSTHNDMGRGGGGKKRKSQNSAADGDDDLYDDAAAVGATHKSRNKSKRSSQGSSFSNDAHYNDISIDNEEDNENDGLDGGGETGQSAINKKEFSQSNSRKFSLERVFGILGQVACHCGIHVLNGGEQAARALGRSVGMIDVCMTVEQVTSSYGGCHLFSLVREIV
jgi:hypothetical protein